eukprot:2691465-Ditylum_brightwellii.AAC.1
MCKIDLHGIEGQVIADVLQHGGNFCAAAKVLNNWKLSVGEGYVAVSTIKRHVENYMKTKKTNTEKFASDNTYSYSP